MDPRITPDTKHLVPNDQESAEKNRRIWRDSLGVEHMKEQYEVDTVRVRRSIIVEVDDPFTAALFFREIRRVSNRSDMDNVRCQLTFELSGMTEAESANVDELLDMSWAAVSPGRPEVEAIYYRHKTKHR